MLQDIAFDGLIYWVPMLIHALLENTAVGLHVGSSGSGTSDTSGSSGSAAGQDDKHCGGKDSQLKAVLLTAIPFGTAATVALILGRSSEVSGERNKHIGLPLLLGGCVFATLPLLLPLPSHVPAFLAVTVAVVAADATTGPFWVSALARDRCLVCKGSALLCTCHATAAPCPHLCLCMMLCPTPGVHLYSAAVSRMPAIVVVLLCTYTVSGFAAPCGHMCLCTR